MDNRLYIEVDVCAYCILTEDHICSTYSLLRTSTIMKEHKLFQNMHITLITVIVVIVYLVE